MEKSNIYIFITLDSDNQSSEYDYNYDSYDKEDSDNDSSGNRDRGNSRYTPNKQFFQTFLLPFPLPRHYRDNERSNSPSTSDKNVVTSAPTFKVDDKKPITVRAPVKSSTGATKQPSKRIDLGAATNYGKSTEINSPTHRNTHSEDLFGTSEQSSSKTIKSSSDIENIFDNDDFNPRAGETATTSADFGDFESAFGNNSSNPSAAAVPQNSDFADFSSAFTSPKTTSQPLDDNFLFNSSPSPMATSASNSVDIKSNNTDITADLFGNNVITSAFASQSTNNDLLDDFADLKINTGNQGEFSKFN